jgi:uncharacterized protein
VKRRAIRPAALAFCFAAAPALAQTPAVNSARAAGLVGERYDGYLGIAAGVPAQVRSQVGSINIQRRSLYTNLAASKGASGQDVGITAGCELLGRVGVGQAYMLMDGAWRHRAPGEPAPVPDYCR